MTIKKFFTFLAIFGLLLPIIYIFLSDKPLGTELQFTPDWTKDISKVEKVDENKKTYSFKLGQTIGFFSSDGKIASTKTFPFKATISDDYYATYSLNAKNTIIYKEDGTVQCKIEESGFPFIDGKNFFLFLPGGASFSKYDSEGKLLSTYEGASPIIAFASSGSGAVAGFANGNLVTFLKDGKIDRTLTPGGSEYNVILGADISTTGTYIACVSGQNKQRFVLYKRESEHNKIIYHKYLQGNLSRQTLVYINKDETMAYYDYKDGLGIVDMQTLKDYNISLKGKVLNIQESPISNTIYILSKEKNTYTVTVLEAKKSKLGSFSFDAEYAFIRVENDNLFIGKDNKISRITLSRE